MFWILTAATAFLTLASLYLAGVERAAARRRVTVDRVGRVLGAGADVEAVESILRDTQSDLGNLLSSAAKRYPALRSLELMLYRAGQPMTLVRLLGLTLGLTVAGAVLGLVLGYGVLPAVLGGLPFFLVRRKKTKRMRTFDEQFPAALGLFSRAVAMANLQARLDAQDLPVFVTAVLVQLEAGGNLAETLDNLGEVIRSRLLFYGKVKALTAQAGASANILVVVPFAIFFVLRSMSPEFVAPMLNSQIGQYMLGAAGLMVILGWVVCRKVARVDV
jgi:tight adherence protein B